MSELGDRRDRARLSALWLLVLALLAALPLAHRFLPLVDWPQHLAQDAIVAHQGDASFGSAPYYRTTGWFLPYQGFRWLHVALAKLVGSDLLGGRLALALALVTSALSLRSIVRSLGRTPWLALVSSAALIEANLLWGFAPYVLATTLQLAQLALVLRWLDARKAWMLAAVSALGVAMFFTHAQPTMLACLSVGALALHALVRRRLTRPQALSLVGAMVPAAAMIVLYLGAGGWLSGEALRDEFHIERRTLWHTPWGALYWMKLSSGLDALGALPFVAWAAANVAAWRASKATAGDPCEREAHAREQQQNERAWVLAGTFFGSYLAMPEEFRGQSLAPRVASLALLSLAWIFAWRARTPALDAHPRWRGVLARAQATVALSVVGSLLYTHVVFARFDREMRALDRVIEAIPRGSRVAALTYTLRPEGLRLPAFLHVNAYSIVLRGGMSSMGFTRTGVTYRDEVPRRALTVMELWAPSMAGWHLDAQRHGAYYDYVIVVRGDRYSGHPFRGASSSTGAPRARRVRTEGLFELWAIDR